VIKTFGLYIVVGTIHFLLRGKFLALSTSAGAAAAAGLRVRWWDFLFYMLFGLVVTSFVHIGGVLLTFSYLVIPAVCAIFLVRSLVARFVVGWAIATAASVGSLLVTAQVDLPIGAAIVCALGLALLLVLLAKRVKGSVL
jgi:ABC-type Mn2+/Zn2+ transport system permease subunit